MSSPFVVQGLGGGSNTGEYVLLGFSIAPVVIVPDPVISFATDYLQAIIKEQQIHPAAQWTAEDYVATTMKIIES